MEIFLEFQRGRETYPIFRAEEKRLERLIRESFVAKRGKLSRTRAILFENLGNPPFESTLSSLLDLGRCTTSSTSTNRMPKNPPFVNVLLYLSLSFFLSVFTFSKSLFARQRKKYLQDDN